MTDDPALPPSDDVDDDRELEGSWLRKNGRLYRVIRELEKEGAWIASTRWVDDNDRELDD